MKVLRHSSILCRSPSSHNRLLSFDGFTSLSSLTSHNPVTVSGNSNGLVVHPDSLNQASLKHDSIEEYPVLAGIGMSNLNSNRIQDPLLNVVANRNEATGDKIYFRNRGTVAKYFHTYEPDGSLRKTHKMNFPCFVLVRNWKKNPNKSWKNKGRKN